MQQAKGVWGDVHLSHEAKRDLFTEMNYMRGGSFVSRCAYDYDELGCPTKRATSPLNCVMLDTLGYNKRSGSAQRLAEQLDKIQFSSFVIPNSGASLQIFCGLSDIRGKRYFKPSCPII